MTLVENRLIVLDYGTPINNRSLVSENDALV